MLAILRCMKLILVRLAARFRRPASKAAAPDILSVVEYVRLDRENPGYQSSYPESFFP
jgi:hypothetical protein